MAEPIRIPDVVLNDGQPFSELGFGTYTLTGDEGIAAMQTAIGNGYRVLDTAVNYGNEREVGEAVRRSGAPREQVLVTTKVPGRHHGFEESIASGIESNETLGLDYIDLLLIHWPNPSVGKYVDTYRGLVELRERGIVRSVGVSNFTIEMLGEVIDATGVVPAVHQIELHPYFPQSELRAFHAEHGIRTESWSPLGRSRGELLEEESVVALAEKYGVAPSQLVLRWHTQLGATPIPKSSNSDRQRENADVFGFDLDPDDIEQLLSLERGRLFDADPRTHEEM